MSKTVLHRPARVMPPAVPDGPITVLAPPGRQQGMGFSWWPQLLFPLVTSCGSLYFIVYNPNPTYIAISLVMTGASVALSLAMVAQQATASRRRWQVERRRYLAYLLDVARRAGETAGLQDAAARFVHPGPAELWAVACGRVRVWERRPRHEDFLSARIGLGRVPLATPLALEAARDPLAERDLELLESAERVVGEHREVPDQPVILDLRRHPVVSLIGAPDQTRAIARSIVAELTTFCAPDDLLLAVAHPPGAEPAWEFTRWLPHQVGEDGRPLCGEVSRVLDRLAEEVGRRREAARRREARRGDDEPRPRQMVLIVDGFSAASPLARLDVVGELTERARELDAGLVFLVEAQHDEPPAVDLRVRVEADGHFSVEDGPGDVRRGRADRPGPRLAEAIARCLAPLQLGDREGATVLGETCRLMELLGLGSARELDPVALWRSRPEQDVLRVPIGVGADGAPVFLDLKESARGGMGPHGLVVGATGSGKSELLRTLVTALAVTHSPETLGFVLVDFKGGAAFADLAQLPHVAGLITNLADDLAMVDRMREALFGEQRRRQELLRKAGNLASLREYHRRRESGADLEPLPYLLIIVDEFAELLTARPDFIDLFVALGRLGRSLGMHLLLASQQLEEGRLRGLEGHISYRIALRTFSPADSRAAIDTVDAYRLPRLPGSGYLKAGTTTYKRFRAAHVSRPHEPARAGPDRGLRPHTLEAAGGVAEAEGPARGSGGEVPGDGRATVLETVVRRLRDATPAVHQVWLPPLEPRVGLGQLLGPTAEVAGRGLTATGWPGTGRLTVPIGLLDRPAEQRRDLLTLDLSGPAGHVAVIGAPQTGKSTLVRTLVLALALTHTPAEVQVYGIDLGGGTLAALEGLPHVGGIGDRREPERIRRTVRQLAALLEEREALFRRLGIDSAVAMRNARATGAVPEGLADVVLCVDGWASFRQEFEELEDMVRTIALRGLGYGVHLVLTAGHWMDVRPALLEAIGTRLELRLNDPGESAVDRRAAENVPVGVPGRGLTGEGLHFQVALPRLDGSLETADLQTALEGLVARAAGAWPGPAAPPVRVLPERVLFTDLPGPGADRGRGVPIGVSEHDLGPAYLDLGGGDPHCLVFGDGETGKTTLLRTFLLGLVARHPPSRARVLLLDYRRTLLGTIPPSHLAGYAGNAAAAADQIRELVELLTARLPPADLTVEELRQRSWWSGPEAYVVVDDYELVSAGAENPLLPLVEYLAQARDVGLHLVLARRTGGASRALFEPLLMGLKDLNSQGLLLGGDPQEGPLLGDHRPEPLPAGRALQVVRNQARLVQVAWSPV